MQRLHPEHVLEGTERVIMCKAIVLHTSHSSKARRINSCKFMVHSTIGYAKCVISGNKSGIISNYTTTVRVLL